MTPFHGGFGLLNYQGIRKPAYHAFHFLSKLGAQELVNADDSSWVCRNASGGVQALLWNFTPVAPPPGMNDQVFYKRELPSREIGAASLKVANLPAGTYSLAVYRTGYRANDAYTMYLDMGAPDQLTRAQVDALRLGASGAPVQQVVVKHAGGSFTNELPLRENDVVLVMLDRM
jgi:xylan 1,4-beta-xylosidase